MPEFNFNERSWASELASEISVYSRQRNRAIKRAVCEVTLRGNGNPLFPDLVLYGDDAYGHVLQGWELKFPDTPINDPELIANATEKATRFGVSSFVIWNVDSAALYVSGIDGFVVTKAWGPLGIRHRRDVGRNRSAYLSLLFQIIDDVNDLLEIGAIRPKAIEAVLNENLYRTYVERYSAKLSYAISKNAAEDVFLQAEIDHWRRMNLSDGHLTDEYQTIASISIAKWVNRFVFAHLLRQRNRDAGRVSEVNEQTSVTDAIRIFDSITAACDFHHIFTPSTFESVMDDETWLALVQLNTFLDGANLKEIAPIEMQSVFASMFAFSRRKTAGQFATPPNLGELLTRLTMRSSQDVVLDPCCGTGLMAHAVLREKIRRGQSPSVALSTIWASDKDAIPLQMASLGLADAGALGEIVQVFRADLFSLEAEQLIEFKDPFNGSLVSRQLPRFDAIISNLPFVRASGVEAYHPSIQTMKESGLLTDEHGFELSNRADLFAYMLPKIKDLLVDSGRVGVIVSNSFLGTEWGETFRAIIHREFTIESVIVSGAGRWFKETDVVATLVLLKARGQEADEVEHVQFATIHVPIEQWTSTDFDIRLITSPILRKDSLEGVVSSFSYSWTKIGEIEGIGITWAGLFANAHWVTDIKKLLADAKEFFDIKRGERRGWDAMFFPPTQNRIESEFLKDVLKSARKISGYVANPDGKAFCCPLSKAELKVRGHRGALAWIERFENLSNLKGKPLPEALAQANRHWYQMDDSAMADFVISMNPDQRIAVHRLNQRSFVNQRLIRLTLRADMEIDIDLTHALMNSVVGIYFIEANGFGRGQGVLDLNASKLASNLKILDPRLIGDRGRARILDAFSKIVSRDVLPLHTELNEPDRVIFDKTVLKEFGIEDYYDEIRKSVSHLFQIRKSVNEAKVQQSES